MNIIILAGGTGHRLWPYSKKENPKQILPFSETGASLFQETLLRIKEFVPVEKVIVVTNKNQEKILRKQFNDIYQKQGAFLIEPISKNTGPAIGLALFFLLKKDPDAVAAVLPSDHLISPRDKFVDYLKIGKKLAPNSGIITFGMKPDRPETGYGYIKTGQAIGKDLFKVETFVEKPELEKAKSFIKQGNVLWNSGIFVFSIKILVEEYEKHLPEAFSQFSSLDFGSPTSIEKAYENIPAVSFDYGILEKTADISVIKTDLNWSDVGDWNSVSRVFPGDSDCNQKRGNVYSIDTKNSLIWGNEKPLGVIGVENLIIIDSPEGILVCSKAQAQKVKNLVEFIEEGKVVIAELGLTPEKKKEEWFENFSRWFNHPEWGKNLRKEIKENPLDFDIEDRFRKNLEFGTGGIRGKLGQGLNRFNEVNIRRTTQALARFLKKNGITEGNGVVIGFDTRSGSPGFAAAVAGVLAANNIRAYLFEVPYPTPVVSFAIQKLNCKAGVVITASHNPANYNGYKVYSNKGVQLLPEETTEISREMEKIDIFSEIPTLEIDKGLESGIIEFVGEEIVTEYIKRLPVYLSGDKINNKDLKIVFTPLYGAANHLLRRAFKERGFHNVFTVLSQVNPVPEKARVKSLNPEDIEAYKVAIKEARKVDADIIIATDLDGDRVGCMVKKEPGDYILLSGNQVGGLMVDYFLNLLKREKKLPENGVMIKTIVTNNFGKEIAEKFGVKTRETLTGFKYIGNEIEKLKKRNEAQFLFGYEESCGYLFGDTVREKDGILASLLITQMAVEYKKEGFSLLEHLEKLEKTHGYFYEQVEKINAEGEEGEQKIEQIMEEFRIFPGSREKIDQLKIIRVSDYLKKKVYDLETNQSFPTKLPVENALFFNLRGGAWFCLRPSGTEPVLKIYFGVKECNRKKAKLSLQELREKVLEIVSLLLGNKNGTDS